MDDKLGNVEAKALVDELPDVLRDAKTERFSDMLGDVEAKALVDIVADRVAEAAAAILGGHGPMWRTRHS